MKKTLLLLACILVCFSTYAQITITKPAMSEGMRFRQTSQSVKVLESTLKDTTGTGKSWDFSGLTKEGEAVTDEVVIVSPASTPYASLFPDANYAWKSTDPTGTTYSFMKTTDNDISIYGSASTMDTSKFIDPMMILKFPFSYGNSFNDKWSIMNQGQTMEFNTNTKYVASGSIKTPGGTYGNVALVRRIQEFKPIPTMTIKTETFMWYNESFDQVMTITISYPPVQGQPIQYSGSYDVMGPSSVEESIVTMNESSFYPNPTEGQVNLFNNGNLTTLKVTDVLGRTMTEQNLSVGNNLFSTVGWTSGVYYCSTTDLQGKAYVQKLLVK